MKYEIELSPEHEKALIEKAKSNGNLDPKGLLHSLAQSSLQLDVEKDKEIKHKSILEAFDVAELTDTKQDMIDSMDNK